MPEITQNKRWEIFAQLRATGKSPAQAWLDAGYNAKNREYAGHNGRQLSKKSQIRDRIVEIENEIKTNVATRTGIDKAWVLTELKEVYDRCMMVVEVEAFRGQPGGQFTFNAPGANKALELIGKELGMYQNTPVFEGLDEQLRDMKGAELRQFFKAACIEVGLRVVEMSDADIGTFIERHAPRLGYRITKRSAGAGGAEAPEAGDISAVSETGGVSSSRSH